VNPIAALTVGLQLNVKIDVLWHEGRHYFIRSEQRV